MRVVIIYHLHPVVPVCKEQAESIKEKLKADAVMSLRVDNQREHVQYPYLEITDHDLEEKPE